MQASVYKVDFEAERKAREQLNDERLRLQENLLAVEDQLQAALLTNQMTEMQLHRGYAAQRSVGVAEEAPQQRRIAQEHMPAQAAATAVTVIPAEVQPTATATTEVSLTTS